MTFNKYTYPNFFTREDWGLVSSLASESTDLGTVTSTYTDKEDYGLVTVTGDVPEEFATELDADGISTESRAFVYDEQLVGSDVFSTDDYGEDLVSNPTYEDYGSINTTFNVELEDYGSINVTETLTFSIGILPLSGEGSQKLISIPPQSIVTGTFSGDRIEKTIADYVGVVTANFSGGAIYKFNQAYSGVGTFSSFDSLIERITYDYNESSIGLYASPEDFGGIGSTVTSIDDYGSISDSSYEGQENYGPIGIASTSLPFGTITITGAAEESSQILNVHIADGTINISGSLVERNAFSYVGVGTFSAISGAAEAFGANPPEDDVLFAISGSLVEKKTQSYVGIVTGNFSGSLTEKFVANPLEESITLVISGSLVEKNTFDYVGLGTFSAITGAAEAFSANPPEDDLLFNLTGEKIEKRTYSYKEPISDLFTTDDYGEDLVSTPTYEDYGSINNSINEEEDYGSINVSETLNPFGLFTISGDAQTSAEIENIFVSDGTINISGSLVERNAFSYAGVGTFSVLSGAAEVFTANPPEEDVTINISGALVEKYARPYIGSGSFSAISGAAEAFGANPPEGDVLFTLSGSLVEKRSRIHVGIVTGTFSGESIYKFNQAYSGVGTFSSFDSLIERITYDYNESSIGIYSAPEDFGGIGSTVAFIDDYGSISDSSYEGQENYGPIGIASTSLPFGTITITGDAVTSRETQNIHIADGTINISGALVEKYSRPYIGSGSFSAITGAAEAFGANPPEDDVLFTISGAGTQSFSPATYIASGTATFSGDQVERNAFSHVGLGTGNFSGSLVEKNTFDYVGFGTFSAITGAAEAFGVNPPEDDLLFNVFGEKVERRTYSYKEPISDLFTTDDYGEDLVTTPTYEDYGSINNSINEEEDYGSINVSETLNPFGLFTISGDAIDVLEAQKAYVGIVTGNFSGALIEKRARSYIGSGSFSAISGAAEAFGANPPEDDVLFTISGAGTQSFTPTTYIASGTATFSGNLVERVSDNYVGIVTGNFSGSLVEKNTFSYVGVGTALFSGESINSFLPTYVGIVTGNFSGSLVERNTFSYVGVGTFSAISGVAEAFGANPPEDDVLFTVSGSLVEKRSRTYIGLGTFSAISGAAEVFTANPPEEDVTITISGEKVERRTYSYKEPITNDVFSTDDYGEDLVTTPTYEDYGSINNAVNEEEDYGSINVNETLNPYGLFTISGDAIDVLEAQKTYVGIVTGDFSGALIEKRARSYVGIVTGNFSGSLVERNAFSYVGLGIFSTFGGLVESFGANPPEDTRLFTFSGDAETQVFGAKIQIGLGTIFVSGNAIEKISDDYVGIETSVSIDGSLVLKQTYSYVGLGTFSSFDGLVESFTYDYNESSVEFYLTPEDFGGIGSTVTSIDDYGSITDSTGANQESYGPIGIAATSLPFGTITISGAGTQSFTPATHVASGTATFSGDRIERSAFNYVGVDTATFSGSLVERNTFSYVGLGTFSAISGAAEAFGANPPEDDVLFIVSGSLVEKKTQSYVGEPNIIIESIDQLGIGITPGEYEDFGFITSGSTSEEDSGSISVSAIIFSANSLISFAPATYIGLGTFSVLSGAAEVFTANPPEDDLLFNVSGEKVERRTYSYKEPITNDLFSTDDYGEDLVSTPTYEDYGSINNVVIEEEDYGSINVNETLNPYGLFTISGSADAPRAFDYVGSGSIVIDGIGGERFLPEIYEGSGSINISGSAVEIFSANPPEDTRLFTVSGNALDVKLISSYVGFTSISISGQALQRTFQSYVGFTSISIDGFAKESFTPATYIGTGSFSAFGGAAEAFGANPPEDDVLFTVSGSLSERRVHSYVGFTSIFVSGEASDIEFAGQRLFEGSGTINISGERVEKSTFSYIGTGSFSAFGGTAESITSNPIEEDVLFTISGAAETREIAVYTYAGSGTADFSGQSTDRFISSYIGSTEIQIDINSRESFTPATYVGSGSFSIFGGASQVLGANPPEDTRLFTISGNALNVKLTSAYVGFTSISISGQADEIVNVLKEHTGVGTIFINGSASESFSPATYDGLTNIQINGSLRESFTPATYIGAGSFSAFSGAAEVITSNPPEEDVLFTISGALTEKKTKSYIGLGTFSAITGAAEAFGANPPEDDVLFTVSGALTEKKTQSYVGIGAFSSFGSSSESVAFNPAEDTRLFTLSGDANTRFIGQFTEVGIGTIIANGSANPVKLISSYIGAGSFSAFGGAGEVIGANPSEGDVLFTIFGSASETFSRATYVGLVTATFSGVGIAVTNPFVPGIVFVQII